MALSANVLLDYSLGDTNQFPVLASATIYKGSAVGLSSGYARALVAGDIFVGFAMGKVAEATAANGGADVQVLSRGDVELTITSVAVTDVGKPVYASADGTFTLTQGASSYIGKVIRYVTTNTALVRFDTAPAGNTANKIYGTVTFPITNSKLANGDVVTTWTPGFAGEIENIIYVTHDPVTTGSKAATLNLEIGTTNLTGGTVALTSAACTPLGAIVAGAAITAGNTFTATDTISLEAASVTSFVEGTGSVIVTYSQAIA